MFVVFTAEVKKKRFSTINLKRAKFQFMEMIHVYFGNFVRATGGIWISLRYSCGFQKRLISVLALPLGLPMVLIS